MTKKRIYDLAWCHAMLIWYELKLDLEKFPDNDILKYKVQRAWGEAEELHALSIELENENHIESAIVAEASHDVVAGKYQDY